MKKLLFLFLLIASFCARAANPSFVDATNIVNAKLSPILSNGNFTVTGTNIVRSLGGATNVTGLSDGTNVALLDRPIQNFTGGMNTFAGNVGIGATVLLDKFQVAGPKDSVSAPNMGPITVEDTLTPLHEGGGGGIIFRGIYTGVGATTAGAIHAAKDNATDGNYGFGMALNTRTHGGGNTEKMRISSTGKVGIGTNNPTSALTVIGLPVFANNAAAIAGGLGVGALYRSGGDPDVISIVH